MYTNGWREGNADIALAGELPIPYNHGYQSHQSLVEG